MKEPPDLRELVDEDVPPEDLDRLRRVDALLRSVPPPPEVPHTLTRAVAQTTLAPPRHFFRRRPAALVALAAALAATSFGLGTRIAGDGFEARATMPLRATDDARGATGMVRIGERAPNGNWNLELHVSGLPRLPEGGYYVLWLAKNGDYAATCGTFAVGEDGSAEVYMNASYRLAEFDAWVISARVPGEDESTDPPWLLHGQIAA